MFYPNHEGFLYQNLSIRRTGFQCADGAVAVVYSSSAADSAAGLGIFEANFAAIVFRVVLCRIW